MVIKETIETINGPYGSKRYKLIQILKMDKFYSVLNWIKFDNFTNGSCEAFDCGESFAEALVKYKQLGGVM